MADRVQTVTACDPIPARAGVGLKAQHVRAILDGQPDIGWFEVHAENYMEAGGPPHAHLTALRERWPLSVHGVGMSIGSAQPLDEEHLARLKGVCDRYRPDLVSEHLAWSTHDGRYLNDLLPIPYDGHTLGVVCRHVDRIQSVLKRQILIENPSTYVRFAGSTMSETDFLRMLAERTGCGLLLDVNNVLVCATNHGFAPSAYLDAFPLGHVRELHVGGHAPDRGFGGEPLLIDAHGTPVADVVWALLASVVELTGPLPVLVEWDNDVPEWPVLLAEAMRVDAILPGGRADADTA